MSRGSSLTVEQAMADMYGEEYPLLGLIREVGRTLRAARERAGITQRELRDAIGTTQMQVYNVEQGNRLGMQVKSIVQYAEALGLRTVISFEPIDSDKEG